MGGWRETRETRRDKNKKKESDRKKEETCRERMKL